MSLRIVLSVVVLTATSLTAFAQTATRFQTVTNGFHTNADRSPEVTIAVISLDRATQLFNKFKSNKGAAFGMSEVDSNGTPHRIGLPFGVPEGAVFRASAMTIAAEAEGIQMGKQYIEGDLSIDMNDPQYDYARVAWNVAPVVYVEVLPGSPPVLMVIDPSVANAPVSVSSWEAKNLVADPNRNDTYEPNIDGGRSYTGNRFQMRPRGGGAGTRNAYSPDDQDDRLRVLAALRDGYIPSALQPDTGANPRSTNQRSNSRPAVSNGPAAQ